MSNSSTHFLGGNIAGAGIYYLTKKLNNEQINIGEMISCGLLGGCAALVPDKLEPATNPNHRSFMHSLLVAYLTLKLNPAENKLFWNIVKSGYLSHLALDANTPASLPLF